MLQLRAKTMGSGQALVLADDLVAMAHLHGARLIVNDRADLACLAAADGVHVGQDDLAVEDVRAIAGPDMTIGISTHDPRQVEAAILTSADYLAVGPIYETTTKATGYSARGLDLVRCAAGRGRPVVAIGGITLARAPEVLAAGADAVAIITDLMTGEPEQRVRTFMAAARRGRSDESERV